MEQITYIQAGQLLNKSYETIKRAIERGALTRVKRRSKYAYVLQEQVALFKGKPQLVLRMLSPQELEKWHQYKALAEAPENIRSSLPSLEEVVTQQITEHVTEQVAEKFDKKLMLLGDMLAHAIQEALGPTPLSRGRL